ncbi:MAG: response regulator [Melioribacteraceae bacterium]
MKSKKSLLIVEDDPMNLWIYGIILNKQYDVKLCKSGDEFINELREKTYDLFLIDLGLGHGKNGIELIKELRAWDKYKKKPIIVLTAFTNKKDEIIAKLAGATVFLRKPIKKENLLSVFKNFD